jgi:hypothetical protein
VTLGIDGTVVDGRIALISLRRYSNQKMKKTAVSVLKKTVSVLISHPTIDDITNYAYAVVTCTSRTASPTEDVALASHLLPRLRIVHSWTIPDSYITSNKFTSSIGLSLS